LKKLTATLLVGITFGVSQIAQTQTTVEKGKSISIEIPVEADTVCNIEVVRGGEKTDVRVESNKKGVYQFAGRELGEETIRWEGKMKFRGLKTLGPCRGDGSLTVSTVESAETIKAQEAASLMEAQAAKLAELEAKLKAAEAEAAKTPEQRAEDARVAAEAKARAEAQLAAEIEAAEKARVAEMKAAEEARVAAEARAQAQARARAAEQARLAEQARAEAQAGAEAEAKAAEERRLAAADEARRAAAEKASEAAQVTAKLAGCVRTNKPMVDLAIKAGWLSQAETREVANCNPNYSIMFHPYTTVYLYERGTILGFGKGKYSYNASVCWDLQTGRKYRTNYSRCATR
jgi:chemotaxis protein histidine kinase CheA